MTHFAIFGHAKRPILAVETGSVGLGASTLAGWPTLAAGELADDVDGATTPGLAASLSKHSEVELGRIRATRNSVVAACKSGDDVVPRQTRRLRESGNRPGVRHASNPRERRTLRTAGS